MVDDEDRTGTLHAPEGPADQDAPREADGRRGRSGRSQRLPWLVAGVATVIAVVAVILAVVAWTDARQPNAELEAVEQTAGEFALALTTWDATDGMGDTREQLREAGTEAFAGDVDELFGGTDDLATLEELGARSSGEVEDVLVQSLEGDQAVALAVVVQRVTTDVTEGEEVSLRYARVDLLRQGGAWRIDQVELVVDALQEAAERTDATDLPGFGELEAEDEPAGDDDEDS